MGGYEELTYFGVKWNVFVVKSKADGLGAIKRGEKAVKFHWDCKLKPDDAKEIAAELRKSSTLLLLDLRLNEIGAQGAESIADALKVNKTLQSLDLGYNEIGAQGAESIADALKVNKTLQSLSLEFNNIGAQGAESIADALKVNKTLQTLNLQWNNIGDVGGEALALALEEVHATGLLALQFLSISGISNDIDDRISKCVTLVRENADAFAKASRDALLNDKKVPWGRAKLMIVGKGAAGKTSTVRSLLGKNPVSEHDSTIGCEVQTTNAENWSPVETDRDFADLLAKNTMLDKRKSWRQSITQRVTSSVSGLKPSRRPSSQRSDPLEIESDSLKFDESEVAKQFDVTFRKKYEEKGSKATRDISFQIWDYGGQKVFYALHHLFLTTSGIYFVVFNMKEALSDPGECIETLRFWLDSIFLHAPETPILLVGTHGDAVKEYKRISEILRALNLKKYKKVQRNSEKKLSFFPIDNSSEDPERAATLRRCLEKIAAQQGYVKDPVRLRWMAVLDDLMAEKSRNFFLLSEVESIASSRGVFDLEAMLGFFHQLGVLVHLTQTNVLKQYVVTQPQWLLDGLTLVIRDKRLHVDKEELEFDERFPTDMDGDTIDDWIERGHVSKNLVEFLMYFYPQKGWKPEQLPYLLDLMVSMNLASALDEELYLVPALLPSKKGLSPETFCCEAIATCFFEFDSLPSGVFQRLLCSMYNSFEALLDSNDLFANYASVRFASRPMALYEEESSKRIYIFLLNGNEAQFIDRTMLIFSQIANVDTSFMQGKLKPSLFWCASKELDGQFIVSHESLRQSRKYSSLTVNNLVGGEVEIGSSELLNAAYNWRGEDRPQPGKSLKGKSFEFDLFLSHNWGPSQAIHKKVLRVARMLEERGFRCWVDESEMEGDCAEAMAKGIEQSKASLVFVTREYIEKVNKPREKHDNCKSEFKYIHKIHGESRMFPVLLDKDLLPETWKGNFGFLFSGNPKCFDLSGDTIVEAELESLCKEIRVCIRN